VSREERIEECKECDQKEKVSKMDEEKCFIYAGCLSEA